MRVLHLSILCLLVCQSWAAAGPRITMHQKEVSREAAIEWYLDTTRDHSLNRYRQVAQLFHAAPLPSLSYQPGMFWLRLTIPQGTPPEGAYLRVGNPHINFLNAWVLQGDSVITAYPQTGDHLPFATRQVPHHHFVFRLPDSAAGRQLLLLVDKRFEPLYLNLDFTNSSQLLRHTFSNDITIAALAGMGFFALMFTLFLYAGMRERMYIYYAVYIMLYPLYIICNTGFGAMYLFPGLPLMNDYARPALICMAPVFYILFTRSFLQLKKHFPVFHQIVNYYLAVTLAIYLIVWLFVPKEGDNRTWQLHTIQFIIITGLLLTLIYSIASLRIKVPYAGYILSATLLFLASSQLYTYYLAGSLPEYYLFRHAIEVGFMAELILLTMMLSLRFRNYKKAAVLLQEQLRAQQEEVFQRISQLREEQMSQVSGMLHNHIGAGLSSVKFNLEAVLHNQSKPLLYQTITDLTALTDEVRDVAHAISPVLLQQRGLLKSLEILMATYNRTGRITISLENIGSLQDTSFQAALLLYQITQELIQNTIKHAQATEMLLQLILEEDMVSLYAEDNGAGFDAATLKAGLGLEHLRKLIFLVNGHFEINSTPGAGTSVSVEFPVHTFKTAL